MSRVTFIDTSVLCELVRVPGKTQRAAEVRSEFEARVGAGEQFVLPVTAVIEAGNHIAQAAGDRRGAAERLDQVIRAAGAGRAPFRPNLVSWDGPFLAALSAGNATGQSFVDLAGNGLMGAGDVAILVERDRFVAESAFGVADVGIWTLEHVMGAYA
ncbi:MAG: hypothetical protein ACR2HY_02980 [Acidimicrobiales bacterium]